ncbi:hypothetical protein AAHC03_026117 [Spirometra sp. Aus1]
MSENGTIYGNNKRDFGVELLSRLTDKANSNLPNVSDIDPSKLRTYFEKTLYELRNVRSKTLSESARLEEKCRKVNASVLKEMSRLDGRLEEATASFKQLDTKINEISGKIIHLGEQLERKNAPRENLQNARKLILEFSKFLGAGGGTFSNVSVNSQAEETSLIEKASSIRTLSALCLELPDDERFLGAKQRITVASQNLENLLVKRFRYNFSIGNWEMMRCIAEVLACSKSHSVCADVFIDEMLKTLPSDLKDLSSLPDTLSEAENIIVKIFYRPETVVFHLIQSLFARNLKSHFQNNVKADMPSDVFLVNLSREYCNMQRLAFQLIDRLQLLSDEGQLFKLLNGLAADFLKDYEARELTWLKNHLLNHQAAYYISQNHSKRNIHASGHNHGKRLNELRRDLQARLHIGSDRDAASEKVLLSQEVAINMLDDVRQSAKRCMILSQPSERALFGQRLYDLLSRFLLTDHLDYGITLALQSINSSDPKISDPSLTFFAAVNEGTSLFNFFEKAVNEFIGPLFNGSPSHLQECASRRQILQRQIEAKFSSGLERCLSLCLARVQAILSSEQKKADYKGDSSGPLDNAITGLPSASLACRHVCSFVRRVIQETRKYLDGQNRVNFLNEFGTRFHRILVDHFYCYSFSDSGGFVAMQDVTAYRDTAKDFDSPMIDYLFDVLLKLMNLMLIKPQNVRQVWQDYIRSGIPKELLSNFIQLRADYKSARLQSEVRRYLER